MAQVTILQLNIWMSGTKVPDGIARCADIVRTTHADVVITSESTPQAVEELRHLLGDGWYAASDPARNGALARWPVAKVGRSDDYLATHVAHPGRTLAVYSMHLEYEYYTPFLYRGYGGSTRYLPSGRWGWGPMPSPVLDEDDLKRVNVESRRPAVGATVAAMMRADTTAGRAPVAGGDFNEPSHLDYTIDAMYAFDHMGVTRVWETTKAFADKGLADTFRQAHPDPLTHPGVTWPVAVPGHDPGALSWAPLADVRDRIDFIFHDPAATTLLSAQLVGPSQSVCRTARVDETDSPDYLTLPTPWPTDHRGNLVHLSV